MNENEQKLPAPDTSNEKQMMAFLRAARALKMHRKAAKEFNEAKANVRATQKIAIRRLEEYQKSLNS